MLTAILGTTLTEHMVAGNITILMKNTLLHCHTLTLIPALERT